MKAELTLPKALNPLAEAVAANIDGILGVLASSANRQRFASCVVIAANQLKADQTPISPASVVVASLHAAVIGLVPGPSLRHCYFVPRKLRKSDPAAKCQLEIGYPGYLHLTYGCRHLKGIYCDWVLRGEEFAHGVSSARGGAFVEHSPSPDRDVTADSLRKSMVGAYCYWETADGFRSHRYLTRKEIDRAEASGGPVWRGPYYGEMALKTTIVRAAKWWNLSEQLAMAVTLDQQFEAGEEQDIGAPPLQLAQTAPDFDLDAMDEDGDEGAEADMKD